MNLHCVNEIMTLLVLSIVCFLTAASFSTEQSSYITSTPTTLHTSPSTINAPQSLATEFKSSRPGESNIEVVPPSFWSYIEDFKNLPDDDPVKIFIMSFDETFSHIVAKQLSYCPYVSLCTFSLNATAPANSMSCCTDCSCSSDCHRYDTCCLDKLSDDLDKHDIPSESCIPLYLKINPYINRADEGHIYAAASCPINYMDTSVHHKCELDYRSSSLSFDNIIPVYYNKSDTVYRNKYCALCNGINMNDIDFFEPILKCLNEPILPNFQSESDVLAYIHSNAGCNIHFTYNYQVIDLKYCGFSVPSCNLTGRWQTYDASIESACHTYNWPIYIRETRFKNMFCGICNGHIDIPRTCSMNLDINGDVPFAFSRLLDFNPLEDDTDASEDKCNHNEVFDRLTTDCLPLICSRGMVLKNGRCQTVIMIGDNYSYLVKLRLKPKAKMCLGDILSVLDNIGISIYLNLLNSFKNDKIYADICSSDYMIAVNYDTLGSKNDIVYVELDQSIDNILFRVGLCFLRFFQSPEDFLKSLMKVNNVGVRYPEREVIFDVKFAADNLPNEDLRYGDLKVLRNSLHCNNSLSILELGNYNESENSIKEWCFKESINYSKHQCSSTLFNSSDRLLFDSCSDKDKFHFLYVEKGKDTAYNELDSCCKNDVHIPSLLTCPMVVLNIKHTSYQWVIENNNVHFPQFNYTFNQSYYYLDIYDGNETIHLCKNQFILISEESKLLVLTINAELIVSIVFCVISIVCLCMTITVFCLLQQLRNLPGKNSMTLACSLVLAQVLYLIGSFTLEEGSIECKVVGLLMHFALLLSIFWMNVCTFHLYRVLTRTRAIRRFSGNKRYVLYHVYCIVTAGFFVVITILVSTVSGDQPSLGYGDGRCYISSPQMVLYTFGIPLAFVILSNLVMFIVVIIVVKKTSTVKSSIKHERSYIAIFAKLSTLTGLTWIFGFLQAWVQHPIFSYLFIVLNAGQGIFLFIALICNTRVMNMLKQKFYFTSKPSSSAGTRLTVLPSSNI